MTENLGTPLEVAAHLARIFEELGIPYVVGGAVASTILGEPRATEDLDLVAAIESRHVGPLVNRLEPEFYVPTGLLDEAVRGRRSSFNIIHRGSVRKVDVFAVRSDALTQSQMARRRLLTISEQPPVRLYVATPEDVILQKLVWYLKGGRASDRQWRDVLGVLKVQAAALDRDYMDRWARELGLNELLARAYAEAGMA